MNDQLDLDALDFEKGDGLVSVVIQDARNGVVLTAAFADREALQATQRTGEIHLMSRSRGLWHKGATSGNTQAVVSLHIDCDSDAVLARVIPAGPACHNGCTSCFGESVGADALSALDAVVESRANDSKEDNPSYTRALLADRNRRLKKIGEEAAEFVLASADNDRRSLVEEAADLLYHMTVVLRAHDASLDDVRDVLWKRHRVFKDDAAEKDTRFAGDWRGAGSGGEAAE